MLKYLSGRDAAKVIGVSYATVQRMVRDGELKPTARQGRTFLFDPDYIDLFASQYTDRRRKTAVVA
jgi:excisionase family DNA binding protein